MPIDHKLQGLYTGLLVLPYYQSILSFTVGKGWGKLCGIYGELLNGMSINLTDGYSIRGLNWSGQNVLCRDTV